MLAAAFRPPSFSIKLSVVFLIPRTIKQSLSPFTPRNSSRRSMPSTSFSSKWIPSGIRNLSWFPISNTFLVESLPLEWTIILCSGDATNLLPDLVIISIRCFGEGVLITDLISFISILPFSGFRASVLALVMGFSMVPKSSTTTLLEFACSYNSSIDMTLGVSEFRIRTPLSGERQFRLFAACQKGCA